jgi:hypothetical protein
MAFRAGVGWRASGVVPPPHATAPASTHGTLANALRIRSVYGLGQRPRSNMQGKARQLQAQPVGVRAFTST